MKALGLMVSEERRCFFYVFPLKAMGANDTPPPPVARPFLTPGFIKRITIHCYTQNIKALGLVVSEKKTFFMFFPL